jgi:ElaB/YqjD/DUF883 family membrane-anchored ribosome-binding protein
MNDSPASIERELADTRARLGAHLDELTSRLSPGQLIDQGLAYLREGQGAVFARNLGTQVRDNPLPVALTGIGIAWLALAAGMSGNGSREVIPYDPVYARNMSSDLMDRARQAGDSVARMADETEDAFRARVAEARARILGLRQDAAETASAFADRVQQALDATQQGARDTLDRVQRTAGEWRDDLTERGQRAGEAVNRAAQRGRDMAARAGTGLADTVGENPLLLGALGLAAGVLLGALVPRTAQEQELIGPATDWAAGVARDAAGEVMDRGTRAAQAAASAAWEAARQ